MTYVSIVLFLALIGSMILYGVRLVRQTSAFTNFAIDTESTVVGSYEQVVCPRVCDVSVPHLSKTYMILYNQLNITMTI